MRLKWAAAKHIIAWRLATQKLFSTVNFIERMIKNIRQKSFHKILLHLVQKTRSCRTMSLIKHLENLKSNDSVWLNFLVYYFKIFGLAPVSFHVQKEEHSRRRRWIFADSYISTIISYFVVSLLITWNALMFFKYMKKVYVQDTIINTSANIFEILCSLCIVMFFCLRKTSGIMIFNKFNGVTELIPLNNQVRSLPKTVIVVFLINTLIFIGIASTLFYYDFINSMIYSGTLLCHMVLNATMLQYFVVLKFIEHLFNLINNNLLAIVRDPNALWESVTVVEVDTKILELWKAHSKLCVLSRDMSKLYSLPALLVTATEFSSMTVFTYFLAKPFFIDGKYMSGNDYVNWILFTLINLLLFVHLTLSVSAAINESKNTRVIVNDLLQKPQMQVVKNKLNQFFIYLLQDNVSFTVYDLFSLESSLLVKIAGSITTYMVILLQFKSQICSH